jgi:hypothetical protein
LGKFAVPVRPPVFGDPGLVLLDLLHQNGVPGHDLLHPGILHSLPELDLINTHYVEVLHRDSIQMVLMQSGDAGGGFLKADKFHGHCLKEVHALVLQQLCNCFPVELCSGWTITLLE